MEEWDVHENSVSSGAQCCVTGKLFAQIIYDLGAYYCTV